MKTNARVELSKENNAALSQYVLEFKKWPSGEQQSIKLQCESGIVKDIVVISKTDYDLVKLISFLESTMSACFKEESLNRIIIIPYKIKRFLFD